MEPIVPTLITPQQAAAALGLTIAELARNMEEAVAERLGKIGKRVTSFEIRNLDDFDEQIAGARRMFESVLACWVVIDAEPESE